MNRCGDTERLLETKLSIDTAKQNDTTVFSSPDGTIYGYFTNECFVDASGKEYVPVVHGEWIHGKELSRAYVGNCCVGISYEDFRCSACGITVEECEKPKWKYCPNCGARMDGEEL